jgi:hypothetical protein
MSHPKFDESHLTAYVLGELNEQQMAEVEAWAAASEENQNKLNEFKSTINFLSAEMKSSAEPELKPEQRTEIDKKISAAEPNTSWFWKGSLFCRFCHGRTYCLCDGGIIPSGVAKDGWHCCDSGKRPGQERGPC